MSSRYAYKALDVRGKTLEGFMEATSTEEVGTWLADRQYFVLEIKSAPIHTLVSESKKNLKINAKAMNFFLLQLSSLINAGCPLLMSLHALQKQLPTGTLKTLLKDLKEKIESGKSFSEALKNHKDVFSNLFITMVEVGEVGGILGEILERYSNIHDTMYRLKSKIIKSMIYPALLLSFIVSVSWAFVVYVFPGFIERYQSSGQELPLPTQFVMGISNFLSSHSLLLIGLSISFYMVFMAIKKTNRGASFISDSLLNLPLLGPLVQQFELSLFARILGTLLKCGVPILTSLMAVEKALGNVSYKKALESVRESVSRGESLSKSLIKNRRLFPESVILMTDVGERGGNTGEMLEKAGVIFERDLETTLETVVTLIQPFLIVFLGAIVITLATAMYLPLFDIAKTVR